MYGRPANTPYRRPEKTDTDRPNHRLVLRDTENQITLQALRGQEYHLVPIAAMRARPAIELEMVPEPGNPWDRNAIAMDFEGHRVGYFPAEIAESWQLAVRRLRRKGLALYLPASLTEASQPWVVLEIPPLRALEAAAKVGVRTNPVAGA
jgi:hypothetical protein